MGSTNNSFFDLEDNKFNLLGLSLSQSLSDLNTLPQIWLYVLGTAATDLQMKCFCFAMLWEQFP